MKPILLIISILVITFSSMIFAQNECELCYKCPCTCFDKEISQLKQNHPKFSHFLRVMLNKGNFLFVEHLLVQMINKPSLVDTFEQHIYGSGVRKSSMILIKQVSGFDSLVRW